MKSFTKILTILLASFSLMEASAQCVGTGSITKELWDPIGNSISAVSSIPVHTAPVMVSQLPSFEVTQAAGHGDSYGQRIRGYICVPATASYTFYVSGDDNVELWLSTSENPAAKVRIAHVTGPNDADASGFRQWTKFASQRSALITLQANTRYYIEALHRESNGPDHISVGWQQGSSGPITIIPGTHLSPYFENNQLPKVHIISPANHATGKAPNTFMITAAASDEGRIQRVEFFQGATKLGEDITSPYTYTWANAPAGTYSLTARVTDDRGGSVTSSPVTVTFYAPSAGTTCTTVGSFSWTSTSAASNWSCGRVPTAGDVIVIRHAVTITTPIEILGVSRIEIKPGGSLHFTANGRLSLGEGSGIALEKGGSMTASSEMINFDSPTKFTPGQMINQVYTSANAGPIAVIADNPFFPEQNATQIFNSAGPNLYGDTDLGTPNVNYGGPGQGQGSGNTTALGNIVIISGTFDAANPNDQDLKNTVGTISFDMTKSGPVTVHSLRVIDTDNFEGDATISLYDFEGKLINQTILPHTGNNGVVNANLGGIQNVYKLTVSLSASGAFDDFAFTRNHVTIGGKLAWQCNSIFGCPFTGPNYVGDFMALPVELLEFKAEREGSMVQTSWLTASEKNNDFFTIERSSDGRNFAEVGRVQGAGNSMDIRSYSFTDMNPLQGSSYYRLRQTDTDGKYTYSKVVSLFIQQKEKITIYPNPSRDGYFQFALGDQMSQVRLIDSRGNDITSSTIEFVGDRAKINVSQYPKGIYMLVTGKDQAIETYKLLHL